eukprot:CAMPEP_0119125512 /NCGR_PEP_ID=MMETSP1310-20130426/4751_1 /TAXON_ID=464262 /ORGANISM="Genus nov. species nov., Strain RCC2339" /LENGTH=964 /DNA_ID=CAMNT_0007115587 /DNA_START=31 /DNA_END=2922 /DNA_ORIENTATION=+
MGIKYFWKYLRKTFHAEGVLESGRTRDGAKHFDNIYVDVNNLLYPLASPDMDDTTVFLRMFALLDKIFYQYRPHGVVMLAMDGPAPLSKILTQKSRRLESVGAASQFDPDCMSSLQFCPGTQFMDRLKHALLYYCCTHLAKAERFKSVSFIVSGADREGEGEMKMFQHLYQSEKKTKSLIISNDSDLALFCLQAQVAEHDMGILQVLDSAGELMTYWNIGNLAKTLSKYSQVPLQQTVDDFIFMSLLSGNDYLPTMEGYRMIKTWEKYVKVRQTDKSPLVTFGDNGSSLQIHAVTTRLLANSSTNNQVNFIRIGDDPRRMVEFLWGTIFREQCHFRLFPERGTMIWTGEPVSRTVVGMTPKTASTLLALEYLLPGSPLDIIMRRHFPADKYAETRAFLDSSRPRIWKFLGNMVDSDVLLEENPKRAAFMEGQLMEYMTSSPGKNVPPPKWPSPDDKSAKDLANFLEPHVTTDRWFGVPTIRAGQLDDPTSMMRDPSTTGDGHRKERFTRYFQMMGWVKEYFRGHCLDYGFIYPFLNPPNVADVQEFAEGVLYPPRCMRNPLTPAEVSLYLLPVEATRAFCYPHLQGLVAVEDSPFVQTLRGVDDLFGRRVNFVGRELLLQNLIEDTNSIRKHLNILQLESDGFWEGDKSVLSTTIAIDEGLSLSCAKWCDAEGIAVTEVVGNGVTFVECETTEEAQRLRGYLEQEEQLKCSYLYPGLRSTRAASIVVRSIPSHTTVAELARAFETYGDITSCRTLSYHEGQHLTGALVNFADMVAAQSAVQAPPEDFYQTELLTDLDQRHSSVQPGTVTNPFVLWGQSDSRRQAVRYFLVPREKKRLSLHDATLFYGLTRPMRQEELENMRLMPQISVDKSKVKQTETIMDQQLLGLHSMNAKLGFDEISPDSLNRKDFNRSLRPSPGTYHRFINYWQGRPQDYAGGSIRFQQESTARQFGGFRPGAMATRSSK